MTDVDPLDEGVPRGRYGRPMIIPAGRGGKPTLGKPLVEYDRASSVADAFDTAPALKTWKTRHGVVGIASNPDLAALVAALGRNLNAYSAQDKRYLDEIIERAHDRSGGNEKADYGTAVHSLTEPGNDGTVVIDTMAGDVASYTATLDEAGIEVDATEVFVVNDDLKVAGTFDHTYRFTKAVTVKVDGVEVTVPAGSKLIGDKKTGSLHFEQHAIQLAIYARGKRYDHVTGEREALDVSPEWGVVSRIGRAEGETTLYLVNIADGWQGAKLAVQVRAYTLGAKKRLSAPIATCAAPVVEAPAGDPLGGVVEASAGMFENVDEDPTAAPEPVAADGDRFVKSGGGLKAAPEPSAAPETPAEAVEVFKDVFGDDKVHVIDDDPYVAIEQAKTADQCRKVWSYHKAVWTNAHTTAVTARLMSLGVTV